MSAVFVASVNIPLVSADNAFTANTEVTFEENSGYTLAGGAAIDDGRNGKALSLDGNGQYAEISDVSVINSMEGDFSVSVWFYPENNAVWTRVFDIGTGTDQYIFLAPSTSFNIGKPRFVVKTKDIEQVIDSERECALGIWNNVTVTREGKVTKLYLNGIIAGQTTNIIYDFKDLGKTDKNYLGKSMFAPDPYFKGMIDDFAVYDKALGAEEIKAMAGEAYERELALIQEDTIFDNNALDIKTQFYDADTNDKIFVYSADQRVTAEVTLQNFRTDSTDITITDTLGSEQKITLAPAEQYVYTKTFEGKDAAEYSVSVSDSMDNKTYDAGTIVKSDDMVFPPASPDDSAGTDGAHDPSVFKDPVSGTYYVYSSHNQIFKSEDLIHWEKHYVEISIPDSSKAFIENNYADTTANETYWAPDVIYVEGEEYPYWMYVSVSCGLGARNSVIALVKSKTPGFWTDAGNEVQDCGVVMASKEENGYRTNSIDANIYTDADGKRYFIWGSFWEGIHIAPLDNEGKVAGIDYTSDKTILSSAKNFGTRLYTTPAGVAGPEGPWLIDNADNGFRYMFTSYGWLGSNYNVRIARAGIQQSMEDILKDKPNSAFKDYKNIAVGEFKNNETKLWGYKLIGSYQLGDGIVYVGQGHNSVLHDDDGNWYFVEHCRKVEEGLAYLQVRKLLWTEDGWPVVSPMVYAGEKEQPVPESLLYGTWDLSSVGHTIMQNGVTANNSAAHRGSDLPVLSSQIILEKGGTLANDLGTWSYDNDHTITVTFAKNGDEGKYEFYKNGDTMKLFVLAGYDKDKRESALVMTGTDQNGITQFAKKNNAAASYTDKYTNAPYTGTTVPSAIDKSAGGNPVLGFDDKGNILYGGDPAALVDGDTVYIYAGHDTASGTDYMMPEWVAYSSKDMKNWKYEGSVMKASDISWRNVENAAWASQAVKYNGKYYLYFCTWDKTAEGKQSIGVAVSDSATGPFKDIGKPIVKGTVTEPETSGWNDIDPTVWIETVDGVEHRYLAWGNGKYYLCELNEDMISVKDVDGDGKIDMNDIHEQSFINMTGHGYTEGPWLYRRQDENGNYYGKYYTFFASDWREQTSYAVSDDLSKNEWEYKGVIMPPVTTSNTSHPSVIDFKGRTYFIYHNGALTNGSGFRRSVAIEEMTFDNDGNVNPVKETSVGLTGSKSEILCGGRRLNFDTFINSSSDADYPISKKVKFSYTVSGDNTEWEILKGKANSSDETYVSIQAVNKPGLYLSAKDGRVVLTQDDDGKQAKNMTFRTVKSIAGGEGISLESLSDPGYFVTSSSDGLILTKGEYPAACEFYIDRLTAPADYISKLEISSDEGGKINFASDYVTETEAPDFYVALYDENNTMVGCSMNKNGSFEVSGTDKTYTVKAFLWDNEMKPLCETKKIDVTAG